MNSNYGPPAKKASAVSNLMSGTSKAAFINFASPRWTGRTYEALAREGYISIFPHTLTIPLDGKELSPEKMEQEIFNQVKGLVEKTIKWEANLKAAQKVIQKWETPKR